MGGMGREEDYHELRAHLQQCGGSLCGVTMRSLNAHQPGQHCGARVKLH
jgi:hypothetical protein